jgi:hypothetical protein
MLEKPAFVAFQFYQILRMQTRAKFRDSRRFRQDNRSGRPVSWVINRQRRLAWREAPDGIKLARAPQPLIAISSQLNGEAITGPHHYHGYDQYCKYRADDPTAKQGDYIL